MTTHDRYRDNATDLKCRDPWNQELWTAVKVMYYYQRGDGRNNAIFVNWRRRVILKGVNVKVFSPGQGKNALFTKVILVLVFITQSKNVQNAKW